MKKRIKNRFSDQNLGKRKILWIFWSFFFLNSLNPKKKFIFIFSKSFSEKISVKKFLFLESPSALSISDFLSIIFFFLEDFFLAKFPKIQKNYFCHFQKFPRQNFFFSLWWENWNLFVLICEHNSLALIIFFFIKSLKKRHFLIWIRIIKKVLERTF